MSHQNSIPRNVNCLVTFLAAGLFGQLSNGQSTLTAQPPGLSPPQPVMRRPILADPRQITGQIDYTVAQIGPDSKVWKSSNGQSVTVIGTGMNYWDGQKWNASDPSFSISADGNSFVAMKLQDPTQLAANIATQGSVTVHTPDGVTLRSTPLAIGLYDAKSGKSVILASVTNSTGILVDPQHVVYSHAFVGGGVDAGIFYSLPDTGSFHQDVIFTAFDPKFDPTAFGFAANSTATLQWQIYTEFYNPPQPQVRERSLYIEQDPNIRAAMETPDFIDYFLDFGHYVFGPGKAYPNANYTLLTPGISVAKNFVTANGRTFLIESIPYRELAPQLQALPAPSVKTSSLKQLPWAKKTRVAAADLPQPQVDKTQTIGKIPKAVAMSSEKPKGVDIDYVVTVGSLNEPTLYTSDTTYYVASDVFLTAPVTIESAVFKFSTNNVTGALIIEDTLNMATTNYRPAIFTAVDDNTAGAMLNTNICPSYTGIPGTNWYGVAALYFVTTFNVVVNNVRFIDMSTGIAGNVNSTNWTITLSHSQMVDCSQGSDFTGGSASDSVIFNMNNCLFAGVRCPFVGADVGYTANACNCTVDSTSLMMYMVLGTVGTFNFTNSILSGVGYGVTNGVTLGGDHNGFVSTTTFGTGVTSTTASPYQWTWAGFYYLTNTTTFITNGTTNVNPALLAQLQMKTIQVPTTLPGSAFTNDMTLSPVAQRDTTGLALGFHYDPIDYIGACSVSNATLLLTNGVVLAYYDNCLTYLMDGGNLISQGTPNQRNYIVYYNAVQEQPLSYFPTNNFMAQLHPFFPEPVHSSPLPTIDLRLTTICAPTGETNLWFSSDYGGNLVIGSLTLQDCEVYGSGATWQMSESANTPAVGFTNNVFHRVPFAVNSNAKITSFNNLYYGTTNINEFTISILHRGGTPSPNTNENNVYDGITATLDGAVGYNAYVNGAINLSFTNNNDIITNITWQEGRWAPIINRQTVRC